jgi:CRISPR-associated endonuclease/helicase Cas3
MKPGRRLLAKSATGKRGQPPPQRALLTRHSRDVAEACHALARLVGPDALRALGLPASSLKRFGTALVLCGWIQDLGKANSHFQDMVSRQTSAQLLRHEVVSALIVWYRLREWLQPLDDVLVPALWAALGHHRKLDDDGILPRLVDALVVHLSHADFAAILADMARDLELEAPPVFDRDLRIGRSHEVSDDDLRVRRCTDDMISAFRRFEQHFRASEPRRELALLKAFGIAADVAASAIPAKEKDDAPYAVGEIISDRLNSGVTAADLDHLIHAWAWRNVANRDDDDLPAEMPPGFKARPFQDAIEAAESMLTLAEAGCGSGKSLAAYLWARAWCRRLESQGAGHRQLFLCLPTTGTATEHFKDYALELGIRAELTHSRAAVDIAEIQRTAAAEDQEGDEDAEEAAVRAERQKIEALSLWGVPVVVCTVDTVLAALSHGLKALCTFPAVMRSLLVFDEIHAFDDRLFGHLLVFLQHAVGMPILLMTASLPENRRRAIEEVRPDLCRIPGPENLQQVKRYRIELAERDTTPWPAVERCLAENGKVLWVRNRVDWANEVYEKARERVLGTFPGASVDVYHSRLRYCDRTRRHRKVIDAFKKPDGRPALLVTTQVAEMSLDLSADLLITDLAPIPALVQRMGRLNRKATKDDPGATADTARMRGTAILCPVADGDIKPYERGELERAVIWVHELITKGRALSQDDLAEHFARLDSSAAVDIAAAERRALLFGVERGLWRTSPGQTRAAGYTIPVILQGDLDAYRRANNGKTPPREWLREHEVAIPVRSSVFRWDRVGGIRVAPPSEVRYVYDADTHEGTGAEWCAS